MKNIYLSLLSSQLYFLFYIKFFKRKKLFKFEFIEKADFQ